MDLRDAISFDRMSRRAQRRRSGRGNSRSKGSKWSWRILCILLISVILTGFGVYFWLKSYLHSDEFRVFMNDTVGNALDSDAHFELFEWQGMNARTAGFSAQNGETIRAIKADGINAKLGLGGISRGVWEVSDVRVNQLELHLNTQSKKPNPTDSLAPTSTNTNSSDKSNSGFLDGILPDRAELKSVQVTSSKLRLTTHQGYLYANDVATRMDQGSTPDSYDVQLSGGVVNTSWFGAPLYLLSAKGKWRKGKIFLTNSEFDIYQRGRMTLNGELDGADFGFYGEIKNVRAEELVTPDWQKRVMGDIAARFKVQSGSPDTVSRGTFRLNNGILTALPVLDHIAAYTNTRRFRRLNLSEASFDFRKEGDTLHLTDIVIASEGLVRVLGDITIENGQLDGKFQVGIIPGTLAHIPGAETKVFLRGEKGLLWAPLHITGTVNNPQEDLSKRMIAAAGERMFELVPETGKLALKFAHDTVTEIPSGTVKATEKLLQGDPLGAAEEGVDVLNKGLGGVLDLIPGGSTPPRKKENKEE